MSLFATVPLSATNGERASLRSQPRPRYRIACTNVANLLLAQAIGRRQELAIRSALGAGRARLVRQLLTEALVLALAGALLGLGAAWALARGMIALYPGTLPRVAEGGTSAAVLGFALILAAFSAAFFGILPALLATRGRHDAGLRVGRAWMGRGVGRWRNALISVQVAVTVTVLIAAGLLLRSFAALRSVDLGFDHARLLTAQVVLPEARYHTAEDYTRFVRAWIERLKSIPGVEQAAVTNSLPLAFNILQSVQFEVAGQPEEHLAGGRAVAGDYFAAMGLRMLKGRPLTAADDGRRDVVVVNESFVRRFLKSAAVTGTAIRFGPRAATIVGVVRDLHNLSLVRPAEPEIYMPFAALPWAYLDVVVRTAVPPAEIAAVAIALAAIGVYGVTAQGVRSRSAEFGVRMALGARALDVFWLVERQGLRAPLLGLGVGLAGGWASARLLNTFLYGVTPHDPFVLASAAGSIVVVGLAGCGLPALTASRIDAARALRDD